MMKDFNKGITLIALVVTIIVLFILAGVSISMLTGQNGILNRVQEAKEKTEESQSNENEKIKGYENIMSKYAENLPQGEGTTPYLPNSSFSYKEGNLSTGLVIEDANNNEYVWVEVPKTSTVYSTAGTNISNFTDGEYTKIENDLKRYTSDYSNSVYNDKNQEFLNQYINMLKSVYINGGFWIGRYEAGLEEGKSPRTAHINITENDRAVIKPNKIPYTYVTIVEAQELAKRMNYESCTSSLIFGLQWDLTLKYIEKKNATVRSNLISNSTTIGNYYNSGFTLTRGKFAQHGALLKWYEFNSEEKKDLVSESKKKAQSLASNAMLLTTGATEATNLQQIYDIAGNVYEWTMEYEPNSNNYVFRGGSSDNDGLTAPAKYRISDNNVNSYHDLGFRIGLWK